MMFRTEEELITMRFRFRHKINTNMFSSMLRKSLDEKSDSDGVERILTLCRDFSRDKAPQTVLSV